MNWSAGEVADVPSGVVTVRSTVPVPAGLSAVIDVSLMTVKLVAGVVPKSTTVAPVKPVPAIVHQRAAAQRTSRRADCRNRGRVGEQIGGRGGRRPAWCRHGHVHGARAGGAVGGDRGVADNGQVRRGGGAEVNRGGAGEASAGDRHQRTAGAGPAAGLTPETVGAATYAN